MYEFLIGDRKRSRINQLKFWRGRRVFLLRIYAKTGRNLSSQMPTKACFAWHQRKYRRLVVRGERQKSNFDAFLSLATIHIWISRKTVANKRNRLWIRTALNYKQAGILA